MTSSVYVGRRLPSCGSRIEIPYIRYGSPATLAVSPEYGAYCLNRCKTSFQVQSITGNWPEPYKKAVWSLLSGSSRKRISSLMENKPEPVNEFTNVVNGFAWAFDGVVIDENNNANELP